MVSNDLQWPRHRYLSEFGPGRCYIVTCYIINPRAGRGLFTASPHADNVIYTCRYPGFTRRSGQKAFGYSRFCKIQPLNSVPVLVDLLSPLLTLCTSDDNVTWSCTHCDAGTDRGGIRHSVGSHEAVSSVTGHRPSPCCDLDHVLVWCVHVMCHVDMGRGTSNKHPLRVWAVLCRLIFANV